MKTKTLVLAILLFVVSQAINAQKVLTKNLGHSSTITKLAFSHENYENTEIGKYILSASGSNLKLWDTKMQVELKTFTDFKGDFVFSPNLDNQDSEKFIAYSTPSNTIILWNTQTFEKVSEFKGNTSNIVDALFPNIVIWCQKCS